MSLRQLFQERRHSNICCNINFPRSYQPVAMYQLAMQVIENSIQPFKHMGLFSSQNKKCRNQWLRRLKDGCCCCCFRNHVHIPPGRRQKEKRQCLYHRKKFFFFFFQKHHQCSVLVTLPRTLPHIPSWLEQHGREKGLGMLIGSGIHYYLPQGTVNINGQILPA